MRDIEDVSSHFPVTLMAENHVAAINGGKTGRLESFWTTSALTQLPLQIVY